MWFSMFGVVLILCIAFFQGLQGLFSAVIMAVLTILCAALALGTFEMVFYGFLIERMPEYGEAVAILSIFILSLLILRVVSDQLIRGNMQFPVWVDRIGGGLLGLVSGIVIVGMIQIGFQLLPFDNTFLGFNRFAAVTKGSDREIDEEKLPDMDPAEVAWKRENLAMSPDEFTIRLVSTMSEGALSGSERFRDTYPDFAEYVQNSREGVQRESLHAVKEIDAFRVLDKGYWLLDPGRVLEPVRKTKDNIGNTEDVDAPLKKIDAGRELRVYRVFLREAAVDQDRAVRFRAPQVRIVGRDRADGPVTAYTLFAVQRDSDPKHYVRLFRYAPLGKYEFCDVNRDAKGKELGIDLVFEVPESFQASFIEYKRSARVDVSSIGKLAANKVPEPLPPGVEEEKREPYPWELQTGTVNDGGGDRISGVRLGGVPVFLEGAKFPIPLAKYELSKGELNNHKLVGGHVTAQIAEGYDQGDDARKIEYFDVPEDRRLFYVPVSTLDPGSVYGKARGSAQNMLPTISLKMDNGDEIKPVGKYAFAKLNGQWWFECYYLDQFGRDAEASIPIFDKIKSKDLTGDEPGSEFVYLFLVPPGVRPTVLVRAGRPPIDLTQYNVVAPGREPAPADSNAPSYAPPSVRGEQPKDDLPEGAPERRTRLR